MKQYRSSKKNQTSALQTVYPYIDLHCDTLLALEEMEEAGEPADFRKNSLHVDLEKLRQGHCLIQTTALFVNRKGVRSPEHEVMRLYLQYLKMLERNPEIVPVRTRKDLSRLLCHENEQTGILLSLEEGDVMFQDLRLLELWYRLGVRMIALTWNYENAIGTPNFTVDENWDYKKGSPLLQTETVRGLSAHGRDYVRKMEELGILVDVSHLSDRGFWDVMEIATRPVIASHSNSRKMCAVSRNLTDDMIRAIAETDGIIGINFCADFLRPESKNCSEIKDIVRHILHIRSLVSSRHIAIGTDFDGIHSNLEIQNASAMPELFLALEKAGLSHDEILDIASRNALRVLNTVLPDGSDR